MPKVTTLLLASALLSGLVACAVRGEQEGSSASGMSSFESDLRLRSMLIDAYANAGESRFREEPLSAHACLTENREARIFAWNAPEGQWFGTALRIELESRRVDVELTLVQTPAENGLVDLEFRGVPRDKPTEAAPGDAGDAGDATKTDGGATEAMCLQSAPLASTTLMTCKGVVPNSLMDPGRCFSPER